MTEWLTNGRQLPNVDREDSLSIAELLARYWHHAKGYYRKNGKRTDTLSHVTVALTADQVDEFGLPPMMKAKKSSTNYRKLKRSHGDDVFELEALKPALLQELLTDAIDSVIDVEAFNHELDEERRDAAFLEGTRSMVQNIFVDVDFDQGA